MPLFIIYLIKANIALAIFYLAYRFGLRRLTFYTLNRLFLLFGIVFSATFPLVNVNNFFSRHERLAGSVTYYTPDWQALQQLLQPESFTIWNFVEYVFWAGVAVMTIRFCMQLLSLLRIHLQTTDGLLLKEKVRIMENRINPFSFFKNIYINPSLYSEDELQKIMVHERIHVKGWHSIDMIAGELNHLFYWFNPGAWLMKIAIRENLEFITDRKILQAGIDAKAYQYSLIRVGHIPVAVPMVNNFNFSHLKQRIRMMNKKKSSRLHLLRYLLILPAVAALVLVINLSKGRASDTVTSPVSEQTTNNTVLHDSAIKDAAHYKDTIPNITIEKNAHSPSDDFLKQNPSVKVVELGGATHEKPTVLIVWLKNGSRKTYDMDNTGEKNAAEKLYGKNQVESLFKTAETSGSDTNPNEKPIVVQGYSLYATRAYQAAKEKDYDKALTLANKALRSDPDNAEAKQVITYVNQMKAYRQKMEAYQKKKNSLSIISSTRDKAVIVSTKDSTKIIMPAKALYFLNGKEVDRDMVAGIPPESIQYVAVLKGEEAILIYGEKGKYGVIKISTNKNRKAVLTPTVTTFTSPKVVKDTIPVKVHFTPPKVVYDSERYVRPKVKFTPPKVVKDSEIYLRPKVHFTPPKLVKDSAISYSGQFKSAQTIISTSSNGISGTSHPGKFNYPPQITGKPLFVVDGIQKDSTVLKTISPNSISSITILKGSSATSVYGKKAKNGVVIIYTKDYIKAHPEAQKDTVTGNHAAAKNLLSHSMPLTKFAIRSLHLKPNYPVVKTLTSLERSF